MQELFLAVLSATTTKREAKSYLSRFAQSASARQGSGDGNTDKQGIYMSTLSVNALV